MSFWILYDDIEKIKILYYPKPSHILVELLFQSLVFSSSWSISGKLWFWSSSPAFLRICSNTSFFKWCSDLNIMFCMWHDQCQRKVGLSFLLALYFILLIFLHKSKLDIFVSYALLFNIFIFNKPVNIFHTFLIIHSFSSCTMVCVFFKKNLIFLSLKFHLVRAGSFSPGFLNLHCVLNIFIKCLPSVNVIDIFNV